MNDIVAGFGDAAEAIQARREARERAERERQAAEEKRRAAEERAQRERAKARALQQDVRCLQQTRAIRDYVDAMRSAAEAAMLSPNHDLFEWLTWAEGYADRLDPTKDLTIPKDPDPHAEYRSA